MLEDLVSRVRELGGLWPLDARAVRIWVQAIVAFEASVVAWITYSHLAIARRAVPRLADSVIVFALPAYLFLMNGFVGTEKAHVWYFAVCGYVLVSAWVTRAALTEACREPELSAAAPLGRWTGPLLINALCLPLFLGLGFVSRAGGLSYAAETAVMAAGLPALFVWAAWFVREWRTRVALEPVA